MAYPQTRGLRSLPPSVRCLAAGTAGLLAAWALPAQTGERRALPPAPDASALHVAPDFKVELLYTVPKEEQGSWVSLAVDTKGRITAGDQYGGLYRVTPPPIGTTTGTKVELLTDNIGGAHGLLHAFDSLYVMVCERQEKGLWRLRDTDGDDQYDELKLLIPLTGRGEHGPHSLVLSPDGRSIYFSAGNFTDPPRTQHHARMVAWDEDHLLPRMWDARGHARGRYAPGGFIGRTDPDGQNTEIVSIGFRNHFDQSFDQNGELFAYDSDMEWDQGSPWYVPTRINHAVSGADFGWRSGAGRWPAYYADSLPSVVDIGPGSPTGVTFGTGAKFPAKYQQALFGADWTFGTLYAIHLTPDGATHRGTKEEFIWGKPLPLTDVVINPHDGAMYFAVGGRRTDSAFYRVTYTGRDSTAPARLPPMTPATKLRRSLEALHVAGTGPEAVATAWPHLASPDRFIRFAARVAIERQPAALWAERALLESQPQAAIEALIALARVGDKSLQPRLLEALEQLDLASLPSDLQLPLLRAWELAFTRMGKPSPAECQRLAARFAPHFPNADRYASRELVSLLIFLDSEVVVGKAVPLLREAESPEPEVAIGSLLSRNDRYGITAQAVVEARPDRQQIAMAYALRHAQAGWTPGLREEYFSWFPRTHRWRGGASFVGFIKNIRSEAIENVVNDPDERARLDGQSQIPPPAPLAASIAPKGPGHNYTVAETVTLIESHLKQRNFPQGRAMFAAAACIACHRFNNEGLGVGPDISGAGNRYTLHDLLENIINPSAVISDQHGSDEITKTDGTTIFGRVVAAENESLLVMTNPFTPDDHERVYLSEVKSRRPYGQSLMPPGLINALNEDELRDLVAYILSGGDENDPMFRK